ncbi:protein GDAP2 homolog isoform X1 [Topomyia yanbarensis]|uniref:protein GDAP2 homolog isoform X1 n=1 Tax=Topomyia yanbarensis TaxID=2498891 RepID=UPI00273C7793|nr:protein GDAP2 homolog isoform X1 [Topomyia yanbarensis]XP_058829579.1 protein GDAP2 homolog isoform X1 [Topomyia yanbarensis]XP_058829580.1 protein GDAP2 homolog isoform X1 [Topomyia yanbarensis]
MRLVSDFYNESIEPSLGGITKPLTHPQSYVAVDSLTPWGTRDCSSNRPRPADYSQFQFVDGPRYESSPFACDDQINQRFVIWEGDISLLAVDAITNTTDETLTEKNRISKKIFGRAGAALTSAVVHDVGRCKTGEVCVTPGFFLPAKHIIHTVGPIYSEKYRTASESTLHSCYRNVLYKAKELGLRTVALCDISSVQRNFPPDTAAHIALRTIRRFLEQYRAEIVIVCLDPNERGIYEVLAPLYFPRDLLEERSALWQLPKDVGGTYGEPQLADRQIRIIRNPQHSVMIEADDDSDISPHDLEMGSDVEYNNINLSLSAQMGGGQHSFTHMQGDLDRERLLGDRPRMVYESVLDDGLEGIEHQESSPLLVDCETTETYCPDAIGHVLATHIGKRTRILDGSFTYVELMKHYSSSLDDPDWHKENLYERLLRRAKSEDLTEVSGIGCLYQSGVDRLGRPVVVFCGKWFPAHNIDLEKALLYLIYLLDPIVKGDYVISYFHTLTSSNNYPSLQWLKDVYSILPYKYKKNLKAFYIVHPTFWTKMMTWWFTTFMAPAIKAKVHSLPGVEHLYSAIAKDQLEIPAYITEYDMATNGIHYFQPVTNASSPAS